MTQGDPWNACSSSSARPSHAVGSIGKFDSPPCVACDFIRRPVSPMGGSEQSRGRGAAAEPPLHVRWPGSRATGPSLRSMAGRLRGRAGASGPVRPALAPGPRWRTVGLDVALQMWLRAALTGCLRAWHRGPSPPSLLRARSLAGGANDETARRRAPPPFREAP